MRRKTVFRYEAVSKGEELAIRELPNGIKNGSLGFDVIMEGDARRELKRLPEA
jgi:hypothetical protein